MPQRTMNLGVAMMIAAGNVIPAVRLQIVCILRDGANRFARARWTLLVEATNQPMLAMPIKKRHKKSFFSHFSANLMIIDSHLGSMRVFTFPQRDHVFQQIVAPAGFERF